MFNATDSNPINSEAKIMWWIFFWISRIYITLGILWEKSWASDVISVWNYWLEKAELLKCPKSHGVRTLIASQQFKGSETLLKYSIFVIFCDHSETNSGPKTFF